MFLLASMKELLKCKLLCNPNFDENGLFDAEEKVHNPICTQKVTWGTLTWTTTLPCEDRTEATVREVCEEYNTDDGLCGLWTMWSMGEIAAAGYRHISKGILTALLLLCFPNP